MRVGLVAKGLENLGLESISAVCKTHGHKVKLFFDPDLFGDTDNVFNSQKLNKKLNLDNHIINEIIRSKTEILGFSVYSPNLAWVLKIAKEVKLRRDIPIVFGGIHPTLVPTTVLKNQYVDYVICGEGEYPFLELINAIEKGLPISKIKNLCYKSNGTVITNSLRPPIDLNKLPLIDKDLFGGWIEQKDYLLTAGRGCPFSCSYCCESYLNKIYNFKYHRKRTVESVIKELKVMKKKFKFKRVYFFDPIFFSDKTWILKFLKQYRKHINVPFKCEGHVKFIDRELAIVLKKSKCYGMDIGIQNINQDLREKIMDRQETNEDLKKGLTICDKVGLRYDIDHLFGIPGETEKDHFDSAMFYSNLKNLNRIKVFYLMYFPKIKILDSALKSGILNQKDVEKINLGEMKSYTSGGYVNQNMDNKIMIRYEKVFRMLPSSPFKKMLIINNNLLDYVPRALTFLIQFAKSIINKDYRFRFYIKRYLKIIPKVINILHLEKIK